MLEKLYIENVAVIEKTEIEFTGGFNILTGETGAGKSIIIDSLSLLLGQRASREMIRTGAEKAYVSAVFSVDGSYAGEYLRQCQIEPDEENRLIIERTFTVDGRGGAKLNGRPVSLTVLKELSAYLVNIHGQHMNQQILNPASHMSYVDSYNGSDALLEDYRQLYKQVTAARREYMRLQKLEQDKAEKLDILTYRIHEIEQAGLVCGEEEELTDRRSVAANGEKISAAIAAALRMLSDMDGSACELLVRTQEELEKAGQYSAKIDEVLTQISEVMPTIEDSVSVLRGMGESISYTPGQLDEIETRLSEISRLKKKYGGSVETVLAELEKSKTELAELEFSEERIRQQEQEFNRLAGILSEKAGLLTAQRKETGQRLAAAVLEQLAFLDMDRCLFEVSVLPSEKFTAQGRDVVEFFISANPGEPPKPLTKIASGGELSRIMLAIVNVLSEREATDTIIFDEVDAGVSGKTAQKIGILLKSVSRAAQVLCVTHLAQIAALADNHLYISKQTDGLRTYTRVENLDAAGRREEIARIIGGIHLTQSALGAADELIAEGRDLAR